VSLLPVSAYLPDCGGDFSLEKGIKECSACIVPIVRKVTITSSKQ